MIFFATNLIVLRERKGLQAFEVCAAIGFKKSTWSGYENEKSKPNLNDLMKIIEFFGVTASELLEQDLRYVHLNKKSSKNINEKNVHLNVYPNVHLNDINEVNEDPAEDIKCPLNADKIDYKDALISSQAALIEQLKINIQLTQNQRDQLIIETQEQKEKYHAPTKERKTA